MKKSPIVAALILVLAGVTASVPASAQSVLYDNITPASYVTGSWDIGAYSVADSFTLSQNATVTGVDFGEMTSGGGGTPQTVGWSISSGDSPSPVYYFQATTAYLWYPSGTEISSGSSPVGYTYGGAPTTVVEVWSESFSVPDLSLSAGTYWLFLQDATVPTAANVAWDISSGGSHAELFYGSTFEFDIPSETFQILGTPTSVPEGGSGWMYLLLAGGGLAFVFGARVAAARKTA
jgi:hypothetical protein